MAGVFTEVSKNVKAKFFYLPPKYFKDDEKYVYRFVNENVWIFRKNQNNTFGFKWPNWGNTKNKQKKPPTYISTVFLYHDVLKSNFLCCFVRESQNGKKKT